MVMLARNRMILAKIETTYGTDPTPVEGSNAILTKNLQRQMYEGNQVQRDLNLPYMGNDEMINTGPFVTLTFDVELAGGSAKGVAPHFDELLRACALSSTVVEDTSVTYAPVSTDFESVTIYYNYDGEMQKAVGCRGTAVISMSRGQIPMISFTFTGTYAKPSAVTMYDPTYTAVVPRPFNNTNSTLNVHSQSVVGESFTLTLGNSVVHRNLAGFDGVLITDRAATGNALFEAVTIATKDYFAAMESHAGTVTKGSIAVTHGPTAGTGKLCTITAATAQISKLNEAESDGIRMFSADFIPVPTDAGHDDFSIAFT